jgi:hypothetical protein
VQTQYQTTLQIGSERVVVLSEQPLPAGAQLALKISSPQMIQLLEPTATTAPVSSSNIADNLLNTMLRQALPLQQPVVKLLATIVSDMMLSTRANSTTAGAGTTTSPLAPSVPTIPAGLAPAVVAALKPLLSQILDAQLTVDNVTEPDVLRTAVTNSGLFREARLVQWAQALLKQFPDMLARGNTATPATGMPAPSPLQGALQPPPSLQQGPALTHAAASLLMPQTPITSLASAASTNPAMPAQPTQATAPAATANTANTAINAADLLDIETAEMLRNVTPSTGNAAATTLNRVIDANPGASGGTTDLDALRDDLLKALSARAQKNQAAFAAPPATTSISTAVAAENSGTVTRVMNDPIANTTATTANSGIPVNAPVNSKTATAALALDTSITADTKTTLERLVSAASRQLLSGSGSNANEPVTEDQVLAILRQLPLTQIPEMHATTGKGKAQDDDGQWLLQLLRSSFGALKHLQMQQAGNLNSAPSAHQAGSDNPIPPLQVELPILVAQQWHNVNIEIDRRAQDNRPEGNQSERSWRVTLRFELPQQGIIVAQLNLSGVHVNATLWAEKQATCQQLQQQLKELSDRLSKVGAHVNTLDVRHGQPPSAKTRIEQRLIDIRT